MTSSGAEIGDLDRLARIRAVLADGLRAALEQHLEAFLDQLPEAGVVSGSELDEGRRKMVEALAQTGMQAIKGGKPWDGPLPSAVGAQASRAAAAGISVTSVLDRCMAGFSLVRDLFVAELERCDLPRSDEHLLRREASRVMDLLRRCVLRELEQAYEHERIRVVRSRDQRRAEVAERILAGVTPNPEERVDLGYDLEGWHTAMLASGADAKNVVRRLQARLPCQILPVFHGENAVCAFLGAHHRVTFEDVERVMADAERVDATVAVGEPARWLDGFRLTYEEAQVTLEVALRRRCKLMRYRNVALEAVALQNEALGDALIERCLTPLNTARGGGQRLRRVIRAVFDSEYNKSSAAKALGVDPETVRRHVIEIEQRLGCPLHVLQTEVEIALRVEELRRPHDPGSTPPSC